MSNNNKHKNISIMTLAQANTTAAELTAHIENYATRTDIALIAFVGLKDGMPVEAVKIAIEFLLEAPKYNK